MELLLKVFYILTIRGREQKKSWSSTRVRYIATVKTSTAETEDWDETQGPGTRRGSQVDRAALHISFPTAETSVKAGGVNTSFYNNWLGKPWLIFEGNDRD